MQRAAINHCAARFRNRVVYIISFPLPSLSHAKGSRETFSPTKNLHTAGYRQNTRLQRRVRKRVFAAAVLARVATKSKERKKSLAMRRKELCSRQFCDKSVRQEWPRARLLVFRKMKIQAHARRRDRRSA